MRTSGKCRLLVSEEEEHCLVFSENPSARYAVVCDPIDGSSNLDAGVSVGTIFGIFKLKEGASGDASELLLPGSELVASGFTMYGASAQLVITMKGGSVNGFTMDNALGEFILTHPDMKMPKSRAIYSVNEGNSLYWEEPVKAYFDGLKYPSTEGGKPYSARYIGSMVADAYRTLLYGGIFAYPADKKSPKGKLRILYECAPMAMVFENGTCQCLISQFAFAMSPSPSTLAFPSIFHQDKRTNADTVPTTRTAGGQAVNSRMERMLTVVPEHIHDRSGIFMGSYDEVQKVIDVHAQHAKK